MATVKQGWNTGDIPDQSGRVVIITGANSGLGYEAARALAGRGAHVVLACRSMPKAEAAMRRIADEPAHRSPIPMQLDVADVDSVHAFAKAFRSRYDRLDVLINNAGIMAIPRQLTRDGFEMQLATNHLGHFALTGLLLPLLQATPAARVVPVSSIAARYARIAFDNLMGERGYSAWHAYNRSKLANLLFGLELHRRLQSVGSGVMSVTAHPGASMTNLFASPGARITKRLLAPLAGPLFHSADRGALPILYAATSPDAQSGGYYGPDGFQETSGDVAAAHVPRAARNRQVAARLWRASESLTGVYYLPD